MANELRNVGLSAAATVTLLAFLWAANPIAVKIGLADAPPLRQAWMRFILGGITVLGWAWMTGTSLRILRREVWPLLVSGIIFSAQIALHNLGLNYTTAAHFSVLLNVYPIYTVLLAHFFVPGDRLTSQRAVGVLVAYAGIVLLFADQLSFSSVTLLGDLLATASAILLGVQTVYLDRVVQRIEPMKLLLAQVAFGVPCFLLTSVLFESAQPSHWTWTFAIALGFQGFVTAGFNFIVNLYLLRVYKPSGLATYFLATPVFGVFQSWLILGDVLTVRLLVSASLVVGGIALATRPSPLPRRVPAVASQVGDP